MSNNIERPAPQAPHHIARADEAAVIAHSLVRAAPAYAQVSDDGEWIEPLRRAIVAYEAWPGESASGPHPDHKKPKILEISLLENKGDTSQF